METRSFSHSGGGNHEGDSHSRNNDDDGGGHAFLLIHLSSDSPQVPRLYSDYFFVFPTLVSHACSCRDTDLSYIHCAQESVNLSHTNIHISDINEVCDPCVGKKFTRMIRRKERMTTATEKLEDVHVDLWGSPYPASFVSKYHAAVLINDIKIANAR